MHRSLASAAVSLVLLSGAGAATAQSEIPESSMQCPLYEAAFGAAAARFGETLRPSAAYRFSYRVFDRPRHPRADGLGADAGIDLRACRDLQQQVLASGASIVGSRPVLGLRLIGGPAYDHFSRPVFHEGKAYLTYYLATGVEGLDVVLRPGENGTWTVEGVEYWRGAGPS